MTPNNAPFLRSSRDFPPELHQLTVEVNKAYVDIANNVNARTIGTYGTNRPTPTGNRWFVSGGNQQTLRQVYTFTSAGNIAHNINFSFIAGFVAIYGSFTDGSIWYPLPYVDVTGVTNQISLTVTSTNIVITAGAGSPPSITQGFVVLEWLSNA